MPPCSVATSAELHNQVANRVRNLFHSPTPMLQVHSFPPPIKSPLARSTPSPSIWHPSTYPSVPPIAVALSLTAFRSRETKTNILVVPTMRSTTSTHSLVGILP